MLDACKPPNKILHAMQWNQDSISVSFIFDNSLAGRMLFAVPPGAFPIRASCALRRSWLRMDLMTESRTICHCIYGQR